MPSIENELKNLKEMSSIIGSDPMQVQGPGGNTSFKNSEYMWIKASGKQLKNALSEEIFSQIELSTGSVFPEDQKLRPSIEMPLHRIINQAFVIHSHSTAAIAAGLSKNLLNTLQAHPEIILIPYCRPGDELTKCIREKINSSIHHSAILQNHGLLVWGDTREETMARFNMLNSVTKLYLKPEQSRVSHARTRLTDPLNEIFLTPDHAVFNDEMLKISQTKKSVKNFWLQEMLDQLSIVFASVMEEDNLQTLESKEVEDLRNWEAEKFRKSENR